MIDQEKPLPSNLDAERAVLGACLVNADAALQAVPALRSEDFFLSGHRIIFGQIQLLIAQSKLVEILTVVDALSTSCMLESAGGAPYISSIATGVPRVSNVSIMQI